MKLSKRLLAFLSHFPTFTWFTVCINVKIYHISKLQIRGNSDEKLMENAHKIVKRAVSFSFFCLFLLLCALSFRDIMFLMPRSGNKKKLFYIKSFLHGLLRNFQLFEELIQFTKANCRKTHKPTFALKLNFIETCSAMENDKEKFIISSKIFPPNIF